MSKKTPSKGKKITNAMIVNRIDDLEKKITRIEKLILLLLDHDLFTSEEKMRVQEIEQLVRDGKLDEIG